MAFVMGLSALLKLDSRDLELSPLSALWECTFGSSSILDVLCFTPASPFRIVVCPASMPLPLLAMIARRSQNAEYGGDFPGCETPMPEPSLQTTETEARPARDCLEQFLQPDSRMPLSDNLDGSSLAFPAFSPLDMRSLLSMAWSSDKLKRDLVTRRP